jgi:hypothetical protein
MRITFSARKLFGICLFAVALVLVLSVGTATAQGPVGASDNGKVVRLPAFLKPANAIRTTVGSKRVASK